MIVFGLLGSIVHAMLPAFVALAFSPYLRAQMHYEVKMCLVLDEKSFFLDLVFFQFSETQIKQHRVGRNFENSNLNRRTPAGRA